MGNWDSSNLSVVAGNSALVLGKCQRSGSNGASSAGWLPVVMVSARSCPVTGPRVMPHIPWPP